MITLSGPNGIQIDVDPQQKKAVVKLNGSESRFYDAALGDIEGGISEAQIKWLWHQESKIEQLIGLDF